VRTERLRNLIYAYPTFHRGIEGALMALTDMTMAAATWMGVQATG
jgi:hypothetical protein